MKIILAVDDAVTVRMYHRSILEGAGYAVDEAVDGIDALGKALGACYDLYLVDVNMPQLDGFSFVREMRAHASMAQAPVIMVSAEMKRSDQVKADQAGANLYLIKPTRPDVLLAHVRRMLGDAVR